MSMQTEHEEYCSVCRKKQKLVVHLFSAKCAECGNVVYILLPLLKAAQIIGETA